MDFEWPYNRKEAPALVKVDDRTAYFKDGSSKIIDAIILCTEYKHHFSFLLNNLRLKTANRLATADPYKGTVWVHNSKFFYLGMQGKNVVFAWM